LHGQRGPSGLLLVSTGNISNAVLEKESHTHVDPVLDAVETGRFVELGEGFLTVHE
jgi:hypothetical protein